MKDRLKLSKLQPTECDRYLSIDCTSAIKGVAIILMIVHHFFTFPSYYIEGISYPYLKVLQRIFAGQRKSVSVFLHF